MTGAPPAGSTGPADRHDGMTACHKDGHHADLRLGALWVEARALDARLNDEANDGREAVPPDGDAYNDLYGLVQHYAGGRDAVAGRVIVELDVRDLAGFLLRTAAGNRTHPTYQALAAAAVRGKRGLP